MKKVLLFLVCLLCCIGSKAQQPFSTYFEFGGDTTTAPKQTVSRDLQTDSTGIYCFGNTVNWSKSEISTYACKFGYNGSLLWKKVYRFPGNLNYIWGQNIIVKTEKNFTIVGVDADTTIQDSTQIYQPFLLWVNTSGDSIRMVKHIDSLHDRNILCATKSSDNGILAAGVWGSATRSYNPSTRLYVPTSNSLYLVKYDSVGSIVWEKNYFPTSQFPVNPLRIALAADGGILVAGLAYTGIAPSFGHFFAKFDSSGNFLWSRRYPYNMALYSYLGIDYADLYPLDDGGYYFTYMANTKPPSSDPYDYNAVYAYGRANAQGDTLWLKTYAEWVVTPTQQGYRYSAPVSMSVDKEKNLLLQGHVLDSGNYAPMLLITDSNGRIKSERIYNPYRGYGNPWMAHTVRSPYNTLVHFGSIEFQRPVPGLIDTLGTYAWLMQTDSFGCMQPGCEIADTVWHYNPTAVAKTDAFEQVVLYPNPASHKVVLEGVPPNSRYEIVDMKGTSAGSGVVREQRTEINVEALVPGVYIIRLSVGSVPPVQLRLVKH